MSKPKKSKANPKNHLKHIRVGSVAADIFRGAQAGHSYLYFEISRAWQSGTSENWSKKLYDRNEAQICAAVSKACQWMNEHPEAADGLVAAAQEAPLHAVA